MSDTDEECANPDLDRIRRSSSLRSPDGLICRVFDRLKSRAGSSFGGFWSIEDLLQLIILYRVEQELTSQ